MKKIIVLFVCLCSSMALIAQNEKTEGDNMAAAGNFSGAAMMYRLCMKQDEECLLKLIRLLYEEKVEPQFTNELFQLVNPLAEKNNAEAQFYLGVMYLKGFDTKDSDKSYEWIKKSAEQDNADAQYQLGLMYQQGLVIKQDMDEALIWYRRSMMLGNEQAKIAHDEIVNAQTNAALNQIAEQTPTDVPPVYIPKEKKDRSSLFFIIGGVGLAAGSAGFFLVPPKETIDWSASNETQTYLITKKRNPVFLIAGGVVGGVCIGSGLIIKKKFKAQSYNYASDYYHPQTPDYAMRLNLVSTGNGAGLRLTF